MMSATLAATLVWVYPEKRREPLGATRWVVTWWTLKPGRQNKDEIDFDTDIEQHRAAFATQQAARRRARVLARSSFFGCAEVQQQRVEWFVEEDRVAEWADVGQSEEWDS